MIKIRLYKDETTRKKEGLRSFNKDNNNVKIKLLKENPYTITVLLD